MRGLALLATLGTLSLMGCDPDDRTAAQKSTADLAEDTQAMPWKAPEISNLSDPQASSAKKLELSGAEKFPQCHEIFEANGKPKSQFPLTDPARRPLILAGCAPEAYRVLEDGTRYIAYAITSASAGRGLDLRLAAYNASGQLAWHASLDRSANAKNFRANFRGTFIAPLLPRLVCFGTLWQGGTQANCVDAKTGESTWTGMMPFWSGMMPQPFDTSLVAAGLNGLTRRYPYSGVEMRAHEFDHPGGRTGFYATDAEHLFFASAHANSPRMTAFRLNNFEPQWALELPAQPSPGWTHAFKDLGIVLFKISDAIYAAEASTGRLLWGAHVGADEPPVVAHDGKLYLLLRREFGPNRLFEIEPKTGLINWFAPVPTGTLDLLTFEGALILRSVRAVQKVALADGDSDHARSSAESTSPPQRPEP